MDRFPKATGIRIAQRIAEEDSVLLRNVDVQLSLPLSGSPSIALIDARP